MHHDLDLTKRGQRYARRFDSDPANINSFAPGGCPAGIEPRVWRAELEAHVERHLNIVTGLLALLDDGLDPDLEPYFAGYEQDADEREPDDDFEFSLGYTLATMQEGSRWHAHDWGDGDREDEHDGREPDDEKDPLGDGEADYFSMEATPDGRLQYTAHDAVIDRQLDDADLDSGETIPGGNEQVAP
jgi:hypothetical protein